MPSKAGSTPPAELLTSAGPGAQIRDPISNRCIWVPRSKLGEEVASVAEELSKKQPAQPFRAFTLASPCPVRFPVRQPDGLPAGNITLPAGESLDVLAEEGDYFWVKARQHTGWIRKNSVDATSESSLLALASFPSPRTGNETAVSSQSDETTEAAPLIPFSTSNGHAYRELVPLELNARVLGRRNYPIPGQRGGFWGTEVMPVGKISIGTGEARRGRLSCCHSLPGWS